MGKVLFLDSPAFGKTDMIEAFEEIGFSIQLFYNKSVLDRVNTEFDRYFEEYLKQEKYDFVFSFNYYPSLSRGCQKYEVKYIAYVYDSPHVALFSSTILNPCNSVFLFDRQLCDLLQKGGIETVCYLPLAVNTKRLDKIKVPQSALDVVSADVSFVGSLYNEKHNLYEHFEQLDEETKGYVNGIVEAQLAVHGYYFLEDLLDDALIKKLSKVAPYKLQPDGVESLSYIYSDYFLARKMTSMERQRYLRAVSDNYSLKLFTHQKPEAIPKANFVGPIDWEESMPAVFRNSKINLNISLRSIRSGIPLRAFDIMGAGGFLLSNFQSDYLECFVPNEDFVYYENQDDMLRKIDYYLSHEKERREIAKNGYEKVKREHSYVDRARQMLGMQ